MKLRAAPVFTRGSMFPDSAIHGVRNRQRKANQMNSSPFVKIARASWLRISSKAHSLSQAFCQALVSSEPNCLDFAENVYSEAVPLNSPLFDIMLNSCMYIVQTDIIWGTKTMRSCSTCSNVPRREREVYRSLHLLKQTLGKFECLKFSISRSFKLLSANQ